MRIEKKLGIYMDHSIANLMEFNAEPFCILTIDLEFQQHEKPETSTKSDNSIHNKVRQLQIKYYKNISIHIKGFSQVVLLGPTTAKHELYNMLRENQSLMDIKIDIKETDKLTSKQQQAFVRKHFSAA